jgi:hypothetical protein
MEQKAQPFEKQGHDLTGSASLDFRDGESMKSLLPLIPGLDTSLYEPVAVKIFMSAEMPVVTVYARDLMAPVKLTGHDDPLPVKKFKTSVAWDQLFRFIKSFDLVVHDGKYHLQRIRVINK